MEPKLIWMLGGAIALAVGVLVTSIFFAVRGPREDGHGSSVFLLGTVLGASLVIGLPALVFQFGLPAAHLGLFPLVIAFTLQAFNQTSQHGKVYESVLTTLVPEKCVALIFAVCVTGLELHFAGFAVSTLTDNFVSAKITIYVLAATLIAQACFSGVRTFHTVSLLVIVALLTAVGGLGALHSEHTGGLAGVTKVFEQMQLQASDVDAASFEHLFSFGSDQWSAIALATTLLACMGIGVQPAIRQWSTAIRNSERANKATPARALVFLSCLFTVTSIMLALIGYTLGANSSLVETAPEVVNPVMSYLLDEQGAAHLLETSGGAASLLPFIFNLFSDVAPWLVSLVCLTLFAASHTVSTAFLRGLCNDTLALSRFVATCVAFICVAVGAVLALDYIAIDTNILLPLSTVLIGSAAQLLPGALLRRTGVTISPIITIAGFGAGLLALFIFEPALVKALGGQLPWTGWFLQVHPAIWALLFNVIVTAIGWAVFDKTYQHTWSDFASPFLPVGVVAAWLVATMLLPELISTQRLGGLPTLLVTFAIGWLFGAILVFRLRARSEH